MVKLDPNKYNVKLIINFEKGRHFYKSKISDLVETQKPRASRAPLEVFVQLNIRKVFSGIFKKRPQTNY